MGEQRPFRELLEELPLEREHLTAADLGACFDARQHLRHVVTIFRRLGLGEDNEN